MNYWTGEVYSGERTCRVDAPINQIPLFIKQGAMIPMRIYASSVEKGNNYTLLLDIYTGANGRFVLYEDDGTSNDYFSGIYASTILEWEEPDESSKVLKISPRTGEYNNMPQKRRWIINLHLEKEPSKVKIDGKKHTFRYDEKMKVVTVEVPSRSPESQLELAFRF